MKTLTIIFQQFRIMYLTYRFRRALRRQRYLLRQMTKHYSFDLRSRKSFPVLDLMLAIIEIAGIHEIKVGEQEITFPVNPLVNEFLGDKLPTRVVLFRNIISVRKLNGYIWILSRSGLIYGFSTTSKECFIDYMFPDVANIKLPRWWGKFRMNTV